MSGLRGKRVLVTGATGFIGARLVRYLMDAGSEVHGITRQSSHVDSEMTWWQGDCGNDEFVQKTMASCRPEIIFHLGGYVYGRRDLDAVLDAYHGNLTSTVNLLTAAAKGECQKVVLAGSLEEPQAPHDAPSSPYAASKWACDGYARMFHRLYQLPVVNSRIFMVYGPGHWENKKLVPYLIDAFLRGDQPKLTSGTRLIDWVYVDDVVEGLAACALCDLSGAERVDIGTGTLVPITTVVDTLADLIKPDKTAVYGAEADRPFEQVRAAAADETAARIGWRAATPLREGLARTVDWYSEQLNLRSRDG